MTDVILSSVTLHKIDIYVNFSFIKHMSDVLNALVYVGGFDIRSQINKY